MGHGQGVVFPYSNLIYKYLVPDVVAELAFKFISVASHKGWMDAGRAGGCAAIAGEDAVGGWQQAFHLLNQFSIGAAST